MTRIGFLDGLCLNIALGIQVILRLREYLKYSCRIV